MSLERAERGVCQESLIIEDAAVMKCHEVSRCHPEDSENIPRCREDSDGGCGEKTNQVCEHYSARELCFRCEKL